MEDSLCICIVNPPSVQNPSNSKHLDDKFNRLPWQEVKLMMYFSAIQYPPWEPNQTNRFRHAAWKYHRPDCKVVLSTCDLHCTNSAIELVVTSVMMGTRSYTCEAFGHTDHCMEAQLYASLYENGTKPTASDALQRRIDCNSSLIIKS